MIRLVECRSWIARRASSAVPALLVLAAMTGGTDAFAQTKCKPLFGHFESRVAPEGCTSAVGFCTKGTVIGGLQGDFRLTIDQFVDPAGGVPVNFFVGISEITLKNSGDVLIGVDTGALNLVEGQIATLLTFVEGTGAHAGATGHIVISGRADFLTGVNIGDYRGEVCTGG